MQGLLRLQDRWPRSSLFARELTSRRPTTQLERLIAVARPPATPAARPPANACYFASHQRRPLPSHHACGAAPPADRCSASPLNRHTLAPHRTPPRLPLPMNASINISSTPISHCIILDEYGLWLPASPSLYRKGPKVVFFVFSFSQLVGTSLLLWLRSPYCCCTKFMESV